MISCIFRSNRIPCLPPQADWNFRSREVTMEEPHKAWRQRAKLRGDSTMDMLLGGLAFAAIILGQFAAVIAVHGERKSRESDALSPTRLDDRTKLIWQSGS